MRKKCVDIFQMAGKPAQKKKIQRPWGPVQTVNVCQGRLPTEPVDERHYNGWSFQEQDEEAKHKWEKKRAVRPLQFRYF